jgi:hypothetical protein
MWAPVSPSHSLGVLSLEAEASLDPSGENASEFIRREWSSRVAISLNILLLHKCTLMLPVAEASLEPSAENAAATPAPGAR